MTPRLPNVPYEISPPRRRLNSRAFGAGELAVIERAVTEHARPAWAGARRGVKAAARRL